MKYDVLTEPWITARRKDGTVGQFGIRELLCRAHELTELVDSSPHYEFGVYRLLFVFLMDAYRPKNEYAIADLLDEGHFDPEVLDAYISLCRKEGVTFDLFDEKRPFLQCGAAEWKADTEAKSVSSLNPTVPSGNNHIHFDHALAAQRTMPVAEAAKAVCAEYLFCTAGAQGYPSTPNGAPPLYIIVKGNSLFETLVWGMVPANKYARYADPPAVWREHSPIEAKKEVASTSLLYGLLFPDRRIRLLPNEDDPALLRDIHMEQGMNYNNYAAWEDPHVAYRKSKDGMPVNIKPAIDRESWRDLDSMLSYKTGAPAVVNQYLDISFEKIIRLKTFGVVTNNAAYLDMACGEYSIPSVLAKSDTLCTAMKDAVDEIEKGGRRLSFALSCLQKEMKQDGKNGSMASEAKRTLTRYFFSCRRLFLDTICTELSSADPSGLKDMRERWVKDILRCTMEEYDSFADRLGASARILTCAQKCRGCLFPVDEAKAAAKTKEKKKG